MQKQAIHFRDESPPPRRNLSRSPPQRPSRVANRSNSPINNSPTRSPAPLSPATRRKNNRKLQREFYGDRGNRSAFILPNTSIEDSSVASNFSSVSNKSVLQHSIQDESIDGFSVAGVKKYFGTPSRDEFYHRYHCLARKQQMMNGGAHDMDHCIVFEEKKVGDGIQEYPFCPKRPDEPDQLGNSDEESYEDGSIEGEEFECQSRFEMDQCGMSTQTDQEFSNRLDYCNSRCDTLPSKLEISWNNDASTVVTNPTVLGSTVIDSSMASTIHAAPVSPRSKYLVECLKDNVNPRASLILRRKVSHELKMQHLGMGDRMGVVLAESIRDLPFIESINLSDNNLTDLSLSKIINSIITIGSLTDLDLSDNVIDGKAAMALAKFLGSSNCKLKRLIMRKANIDDDECAMFVASLKRNKMLMELDLSYNLIGVSENLNSVNPDLITGSEALADLLESNTCFVSTLHLCWNMIRLDGAVCFAKSLSQNIYLTYLDLSYNSLGESGGEELGKALLTNKTLKTLLLNNNGLTSSATFSICVAIEEVMSLRRVQFDNNPIGDLGAQILMQIPVATRGRVKISADKCNISVKYSKDSLIKLSDPANTYELALSDPFQRAICIKLFKIVATNSFFALEYSEYQKERQSNPLALVHSVYTVPDAELDDEQVFAIENLRKLQNASQDIRAAKKLFREIDSDGSGGIDFNELSQLLKVLSMDLERYQIEEVFDRYDITGAGVIELPEFLSFLHSQAAEAEEKISDITQFNILSLRNKQGVKYIPPADGTMRLSVRDSYSKRSVHKVMTHVDHSNVMEATSGQTENLPKLLLYSLNGSKIRLKQGIALVQSIYDETRNKPDTLAKILPFMVDCSEARLLIAKVIQNERSDMVRLKQLMGNALRPIIGLDTGFYNLDLSEPMDRLCLQRLLQRSESLKLKRQSESIFSYPVGDLSQNGDWSCFRNAYINGKPGIISSTFFTPMPTVGSLHFDFSGGERHGEDPVIISDTRTLNILFNLSLMTKSDKPRLLKVLEELRKVSRENNNGDGNYKYYTSKKRVIATKHCAMKFVSSLPNRAKEFEQSVIKEGSWVSSLHRETSHLSEAEVRGISNAEINSDDESDSDDNDDEVPTAQVPARRRQSKASIKKITSFRSKTNSKLTTSESSPVESTRRSNVRGRATMFNIADKAYENSVGESDVVQELLNSEVCKFENITRPRLSRATPLLRLTSNDKYVLDYGSRFRDLINDSGTSTHSKCSRLCSALEEIFGRVWLRSAQLAVILSTFRLGMASKTTHFGTYRVEALVSLFNRVIDLHNFEVVLSVLTPYEVACFQCRIGILNYFNPMKPEGFHALNLNIREERIVVKMLAALSFVEPGENWIGETFRWEINFDDVPGWELLKSWLAESSLPRRGHLTLLYSTQCPKYGYDEGGDPVVRFRKSLLNLVRIREIDYVYDENLPEYNALTHEGDESAKQNPDIWSTFLATPEEYEASLSISSDQR